MPEVPALLAAFGFNAASRNSTSRGGRSGETPRRVLGGTEGTLLSAPSLL